MAPKPTLVIGVWDVVVRGMHARGCDVRCSPENGGVGTKSSEHQTRREKNCVSYRHAKPVFKIESEISQPRHAEVLVEPMD